MSFLVDIWARKGDQVSSITSRTYTPPEPDPGGDDADYKVPSLAAARALDPQIGESVYVDHEGYFDVVDAATLSNTGHEVIDGWVVLAFDSDVESEVSSSVSIGGSSAPSLHPNILFNSFALVSDNGARLGDRYLWGWQSGAGDVRSPLINHVAGSLNYSTRLRDAMQFLGGTSYHCEYQRCVTNRRLVRRDAIGFDVIGLGAIPYSQNPLFNSNGYINWAYRFAKNHNTAKGVIFSDTVGSRNMHVFRQGTVTIGQGDDKIDLHWLGNDSLFDWRRHDFEGSIEYALVNHDERFMREKGLTYCKFHNFRAYGNMQENMRLYTHGSEYVWNEDRYGYFRNGPNHAGITFNTSSVTSPLENPPGIVEIEGVVKFSDFWSHVHHVGDAEYFFQSVNDGELHLGNPGIASGDTVHGTYGLYCDLHKVVGFGHGVDFMTFRGRTKIDNLVFRDADNFNTSHIIKVIAPRSNSADVTGKTEIGHLDLELINPNLNEYQGFYGELFGESGDRVDIGGGTIRIRNRLFRFLGSGSWCGFIGPENGELEVIGDNPDSPCQFHLIWNSGLGLYGEPLTIRNVKTSGSFHRRDVFITRRVNSSTYMELNVLNCDFSAVRLNRFMDTDLTESAAGMTMVFEDCVMPDSLHMRAPNGQSTIQNLTSQADLDRVHVIFRNCEFPFMPSLSNEDSISANWISLEGCVTTDGTAIPDHVAFAHR